MVVGRCTVVGVDGRQSSRSSLRHSRNYVEPHEVDGELKRIRAAVERAQRDLQTARSRANLLAEQRAILDAYFLMVDDPLLHQKIDAAIRKQGYCAEWAVSDAANALRAAFDSMSAPSSQAPAASPGDPMPHDADDAHQHLRERRHDIDFVAEKLLRALGGGREMPLLRERSIVVARDLSPADVASLDRNMVLGLVTERGTLVSHTSILARSFGMPAVVGAEGAVAMLRTGDTVLVDGFRGLVVRSPDEAAVAEAHGRGARYRMLREAPSQLDGQPLPVQLTANLEQPSEVGEALRYGAEGVGLFRSELLFLDRRSLPGEDEQAEVYATVVRAMAGKPVTLRTFDLGGDKLASFAHYADEPNPALGLRALRLGLREPELFCTQLRAMLRASAHGPVSILLPLVSSITELRQAREFLLRARDDLRARGVPCAERVPLGVMVEVPAVAILADVFAVEADFLSVGTNDLVQYTLAVDRASLQLSSLASALDPSVLRLIANTQRAAGVHGKPVSVCGAAAGDPLSALVFAGLGVRHLSMTPLALPFVREALKQIGLERAERLARSALCCSSAAEVEQLVAAEIRAELDELLPHRG